MSKNSLIAEALREGDSCSFHPSCFPEKTDQFCLSLEKVDKILHNIFKELIQNKNCYHNCLAVGVRLRQGFGG